MESIVEESQPFDDYELDFEIIPNESNFSKDLLSSLKKNMLGKKSNRSSSSSSSSSSSEDSLPRRKLPSIKGRYGMDNNQWADKMDHFSMSSLSKPFNPFASFNENDNYEGNQNIGLKSDQNKLTPIEKREAKLK